MVKFEQMTPHTPSGFARSADGIDLALELDDAGDHAPILFAHGFGQTRQAWSATARRLAATGHPTLIFDARGHGGSGRNPTQLPYRDEQFVHDLAEFLALVPHARHTRLPQATHMVAGDDNDAFTAAILHFMSDIDDRSVHTSNPDARAATPAPTGAAS